MIAWIQKLEKMYTKVEYFLLILSGLIVLFMMFFVTLDVVMRNFFNEPIAGVYEIVSFLFIAVVVLGLTFVQQKKKHIIIEIVTNSLPQRYKNILDLCGYCIGLVVVGVIALQSYSKAVSSFVSMEHTMGLLKIPLWPSKTAIVIGMGALFIRLLFDAIFLAFKWKNGYSTPPEEVNR